MIRILAKPLSVFCLLLPIAASRGAANDAGDPWKVSDLLPCAALAHEMAAAPANAPPIVHVGFETLYHGARIQGAVFAGPGMKPEGLDALRKFAATLPKDKEFVIYCGCCPWRMCPNIRPAYRLLHSLGFTHVKVLQIPVNLHTDWVAKGFPIQKGA